jgi:CubicO group peptidase (beta-lactamase class C family)
MVVPCGRLTYETKAPLVSAQTVYDLASVTKSVVTASLILTYIEEGKLKLADTVHQYIPELCNHYGATIEDLLRYRVRGARLSMLKNKTFEELRTRILEHGFDAPPSDSDYTNVPAYVLGILLERISHVSLAASAHRYFFEPLDMDATTYFPTVSDCAPTEIDALGGRNEVRGLPHDESAYVFARARRSVGHAGLFSTAPDLRVFLQALLEGKYPHIVAGAQSGLGWQTSGDFLGSYASPYAFGKTGFTGTSMCVDREKGIAVVILSNRTYPKRPESSAAINAFRREIADTVFRS